MALLITEVETIIMKVFNFVPRFVPCSPSSSYFLSVYLFLHVYLFVYLLFLAKIVGISYNPFSLVFLLFLLQTNEGVKLIPP